MVGILDIVGRNEGSAVVVGKDVIVVGKVVVSSVPLVGGVEFEIAAVGDSVMVGVSVLLLPPSFVGTVVGCSVLSSPPPPSVGVNPSIVDGL